MIEPKRTADGFGKVQTERKGIHCWRSICNFNSVGKGITDFCIQGT